MTTSAVYNGTWVRQTLTYEPPLTGPIFGENSMAWNGYQWQMYSGAGAKLNYATCLSAEPLGPWWYCADYLTLPGPGAANSTYCRPNVRIIGGVYHCVVACAPDDDGSHPFVSTQFDHFTSDTGTTWTLAQADILGLGASGKFDDYMLGNNDFWLDEDGNWYFIYDGYRGGEGVWKLGMASGDDLDSLTRINSGDPVLGTDSLQYSSPSVGIKDGVYYCWGHGGYATTTPTDMLRASASAPGGPYTIDCNPLFVRVGYDEGAGTLEGQIADPCVVEYNGALYMTFTAAHSQSDPFVGKIAKARFGSPAGAGALLPVLGSPIIKGVTA